MTTPIRIQGPGYFHVYTVATGGDDLFLDSLDRQLLIGRLERISTRLGWQLFAYCLMTTHYHAVLETRAPNLSRGMQWVNSGYVTWFNRRWARSGTLVARRFGYRVIESDEYLEEACRYVWSNPVRAGLCPAAADWAWSGGVWFATLRSL